MINFSILTHSNVTRMYKKLFYFLGLGGWVVVITTQFQDDPADISFLLRGLGFGVAITSGIATMCLNRMEKNETTSK